MKLQHIAQVSTVLWMIALGLMLTGTFLGDDLRPFFWAVGAAAVAAATTVVYFVRRERLRTEMLLRRDGPTGVAR